MFKKNYYCKILAVFTLCVLLLTTLTACGVKETTNSTNQQGTIESITVGSTMAVSGINIDDYYFGIMRAGLSHKGLLALDENGDFSGDLAESWNTADAKVWTFKIREGLKWHDGRDVKASDVKFSLEYLKDKIPVYKSHLKLLQTVDAVDENTVVITLSEPNSMFPVNLLAVRIIPQHIFESVDVPQNYNDPKAAIGCGPYIFESFDEAAGVVTFKANENYYRGEPNVKKVIFRLFKNADTMYLALKKGEIDLSYFYAAGTDPIVAENLAQEPNLKLHLIDNLGVPNAIFFNTQKPPVDNPEFRKAISYAINYEEMIKLFALGYGTVPNAGFVPAGTSGYVDTPKLLYDLKKAEKMLEELGYQDKNKDGIREKDGQKLELEFVVRNDLPENMRIAELLKLNMEAVGVALNIKAVDNTLFRTISDQDKSHISFLSRTTAWGMMMWAGFGTGYFDSRNIGWAVVDNQEYHQLVDKMLNTTDLSAYKKLGGEAQKYHATQLPAIPLYWNKLVQPYNKKYEGWKVSPMYGFLWEESWYSLSEAGE